MHQTTPIDINYILLPIAIAFTDLLCVVGCKEVSNGEAEVQNVAAITYKASQYYI